MNREGIVDVVVKGSIVGKQVAEPPLVAEGAAEYLGFTPFSDDRLAGEGAQFARLQGDRGAVPVAQVESERIFVVAVGFALAQEIGKRLLPIHGSPFLPEAEFPVGEIAQGDCRRVGCFLRQ